MASEVLVSTKIEGSAKFCLGIIETVVNGVTTEANRTYKIMRQRSITLRHYGIGFEYSMSLFVSAALFS